MSSRSSACSSSSAECQEHAARAIANLCSGACSSNIRDQLLDLGSLQALIWLLVASNSQCQLVAAMAIKSICEGDEKARKQALNGVWWSL